MIRVTFVCLGNICRSPMGEAILKKLAADMGLESSFLITSRGTSDEEEGNPVYPPALKTLRAHGYDISHRAAQLTLQDVINCDYILVMNTSNLMDVLRLTAGKFGGKVFKLLSFTGEEGDVADPWYTRDFERAFYDIERGCRAFLDYVLKEHKEELSYDRRH